MKRFVLSLVLATALLTGGLTLPATAGSIEAARKEVCTGVSGTGADCGTGGVELTKVIKAVLNVMSVIAGVAAIIMIIISGMKYITSNGDPQAVSGAKRTLIYAIVGLIVVAMSQFIVRFVLQNAK